MDEHMNPKDDMFLICGKLMKEFPDLYIHTGQKPKITLIPLGTTANKDGSKTITYGCKTRDSNSRDFKSLTEEEKEYCLCCSGIISQKEIILNPEML